MGAEVLDFQFMQRPVRGMANRDYGSRNTIVGTEAIRLSLTEGSLSDIDDSAHYIPSDSIIPKTAEEIQWIKEIIKENFLFNHLDEAKVHHLFIAFYPYLTFDEDPGGYFCSEKS
jgi:hypothetical protein